MKILTKLSIISVLFFMLTARLSAVLPAPVQKAAESNYTEIKYWADTYSYKWVGEDRVLVLTGNVKFVQGDTTILADKVNYRESTKTAIATGNLKIYDPQNTATGKECKINFKDKKCTLSGTVQMIARPRSKPDKAADSKSKQILKDEVTAICESVDYYYKEKKAVIPSTVTIVQKARTVTADSATYYGKDEILELIGNVKGRDNKDKHNFAAPKVRISLKDGNEWLEAEKATGTIYVQEEPSSEAVSR